MKQFIDEIDEEGEEDKMKLELMKRERDTERKIVKTLNVILRKSIENLLIEDKKFLKARASYLTNAQRAEYKEIIDADYTGQKPAEKKLEDHTRAELETMAKDLGIEEPEKLSNKQAVIDAIRKAQ